MPFFSIKRLATVLSALGLALGLTCAQGQQEYPSKQIRVIVPYPAGGTTDVLARMIGNDIAQAWEVPVVVENKTGASGMIGNDIVAKAPGDGYTILMGIATLLQGPHMFTAIPYDFKKDFTPLALVAISSNLLIVPSRFPANTFEEFLRVVQANPGKYSYGSYGAGTTAHIHGETLKRQAKLDLTHVPYKGGSPLMNDLLGGQVDAGFVDIGNVKASLQSDKIKVLAVTGEQRLKILPNIRTLTELGYTDFEPYPFFALYVPSSTPQAIVDKLGNQIAQILKRPGNVEKIEGLGLVSSGQIGAEFKATVQRDYNIWGKVIRDGNIKVEQ